MSSLDLGKVVGSKMHNVTGTPEASLGLENDWAMNVDTGEVWEKTQTGWTSRGSLKGGKGDPGQNGADGAPGAKGDTGDQGPKGDTGDQGPKGDPGADGKDGLTPTFTVNDEGHLIATFNEPEA